MASMPLMRWELPISFGDTSSMGLSFRPNIFSAWGRTSKDFLVVLTALGVGLLVASVVDRGADESDGVGRILFELDDTGGVVDVSLLAGAGLDVLDGDGVGAVVARVLASDVIVMRTGVSSEWPD